MSIWKREPEKLRLEGVETLEQVRKRAFDEMQKLVKANRGGSIAIVSHRVILKLLLLSMLNLGSDYFWKIRQNSCCVNRIEHSETDGFIILTVNETCHLK
jgi:broad specificity phosphatase PhoE